MSSKLHYNKNTFIYPNKKNWQWKLTKLPPIDEALALLGRTYFKPGEGPTDEDHIMHFGKGNEYWSLPKGNTMLVEGLWLYSRKDRHVKA
jgi:hypothetical protein